MKRYTTSANPQSGALVLGPKTTAVFCLAAEAERIEQAYEMMDKWFCDTMTQNQVDIIDAILNGAAHE